MTVAVSCRAYRESAKLLALLIFIRLVLFVHLVLPHRERLGGFDRNAQREIMAHFKQIIAVLSELFTVWCLQTEGFGCSDELVAVLAI